MKALVDRRARIAKIRTIEKRVAEFALARADRDLKHVESIVERLGALKNGLNVADGAITGASLAAIAETKLRLASAGRATAKPLLDATTRRHEQHASAMSAHRRADGAETLLQKSSANATRAEAVRADANRIDRRVTISGDDT